VVGILVPFFRRFFDILKVDRLDFLDSLFTAIILLVSFFPLIFLFVLTITLIRHKRFEKYKYKIFNFSISASLFLIGVRVKYFGRRDESAKVVIANHTSPLDYFLIAQTMGTKDWNVLAGINLAFNRRTWSDKLIAWSIGYIVKNYAITIDRTDEVSRKKSFERMNQELRDGKNIAVFPEGTRTPKEKIKQGVLLQDFKIGAFKLAWQEKSTIQPVVYDLPALWKGKDDKFWGIHPCRIKAYLLEAVDPKDFDRIEDFMDTCRVNMLEVLKKSKTVKSFIST
jgi:1-acyl-sn-glycerol-3-phosphate acyltransferase